MTEDAAFKREMDTQKLKRDKGLCYEHCYDGGFLSMGAWERTQRPQHNEVCFTGNEEKPLSKEL